MRCSAFLLSAISPVLHDAIRAACAAAGSQQGRRLLLDLDADERAFRGVLSLACAGQAPTPTLLPRSRLRG